MAERRVTRQDDIERLAENLHRNKGNSIIDERTFSSEFDNYLGATNDEQDTILKSKVLDAYKNMFTIGKDFFKEAKGKDFKKDKRKQAKNVVTTVKEYKKRGASKVDLEGYDMPKKKRYDFTGRQKGRVVFARKLITKGGTRYIDKKGRYVSVK